MTIKELMKQKLIDCMMMPEDADAVLALAEQDYTIRKSQLRWRDNVEGYEPKALVAIWYNVRVIALKWIDENCPLAFYREMFV